MKLYAPSVFSCAANHSNANWVGMFRMITWPKATSTWPKNATSKLIKSTEINFTIHPQQSKELQRIMAIRRF